MGGASVTRLITSAAAAAAVGVLEWVCGRHSSVYFFQESKTDKVTLPARIDMLFFRREWRRSGGRG